MVRERFHMIEHTRGASQIAKDHYGNSNARFLHLESEQGEKHPLVPSSTRFLFDSTTMQLKSLTLIIPPNYTTLSAMICNKLSRGNGSRFFFRLIQTDRLTARVMPVNSVE